MQGPAAHFLAAAAYGALALWFWRSRWRARAAGAGLAPWERWAILAALLAHGAILAALLLAPEAPRFGFAFALSSMLWLAVLFYWVESFYVNLESVQPVALGLAALAAPLTAIFPGRVPATTSLEFRAHLALAILAYGVLTIALLHAVMMALVERLLHRARGAEGGAPSRGVLEGPIASLPPLLTLERMLFRLISAGFVLLTLTLASGMTLSDSLFGRALRFNHETLFALVSWAVFAVLLAGRAWYGWRGRTALRWVLAGFIMVVLAGIGSRFVLEVVLGRP
jgi:ABC-type uncharacterized transport system permease subunit